MCASWFPILAFAPSVGAYAELAIPEIELHTFMRLRTERSDR